GRVDQLGGRHLACADHVGLVGCVHPGEVVGHEPPPIVAACGLGSSCSSGCPALARARLPPLSASASPTPACSTRTPCAPPCSTRVTTAPPNAASPSRPCSTPPATTSDAVGSWSSTVSPSPASARKRRSTSSPPILAPSWRP